MYIICLIITRWSVIHAKNTCCFCVHLGPLSQCCVWVYTHTKMNNSHTIDCWQVVYFHTRHTGCLCVHVVLLFILFKYNTPYPMMTVGSVFITSYTWLSVLCSLYTIADQQVTISSQILLDAFASILSWYHFPRKYYWSLLRASCVQPFDPRKYNTQELRGSVSWSAVDMLLRIQMWVEPTSNPKCIRKTSL